MTTTFATATVDWGGRPRGQGRRSRGQVVGGMSAAPTGRRVYRDYRASVPGGMTDAEYSEIRVFAQDEDRELYVALRQAGAAHGDACLAVYRAAGGTLS